MAGSGQPTIGLGRRVVDIFKGLSEHHLVPNVNSFDINSIYMSNITVNSMLKHLGLGQYVRLFVDKPWNYVSDLTAEKLSKLGVRDPDHITMIIGCFERFFTYLDPGNNIAILTEVLKTTEEFKKISDDMHKSIVKHFKDAGGHFERYDIEKIESVHNERLARRYVNRRSDVAEDRHGIVNEQVLYHGTPFVNAIVNGGFKVSLTNKTSYFGSGIYFSNLSSKSNRFVFGSEEDGCPEHGGTSCYKCPRKLLMCKVILGVSFDEAESYHFCHAPDRHDSVHGIPSDGENCLEHEEFVVYENNSVLPVYVITYRIVDPKADRQD